ncbi:conserved membrane hypothetical protein [uncultured Mycobacterium sp.]|uniref:Transmembrane protein n=1 Tax=uncultured Mycobacterium sp. TaxID=171292 RepID=A0A1Y5P9E3_9MYCO|nr:conserved membrane hypothetical protein [uncultured Mycobacterium sp.]
MARIFETRPTAGAVAAVVAGAVMLAATTFGPPKPSPEQMTPRISTQTVHLAALPGPLTPAPHAAAAASATPADVGQFLQSIPAALGRTAVELVYRVIAGAGGGAFAGFVAVGAVASMAIYGIPVVGMVLVPIIPVAAIVGAVVGAPIGAVLGALSLLPRVSVRVPVAGKKAPTTVPHRTTQPGARSSRHIAKSSAPATSKATAPQQRSEAKRTVAGSARHAASSNTR